MNGRRVLSSFLALLFAHLSWACAGPRLLPHRNPKAKAPQALGAPAGTKSADTDSTAASQGTVNSSAPDPHKTGLELDRFRFLTLEEEALAANSFEGLKSVWIFWPAISDDQPNHSKVDAFRARLDQLLRSRGDIAILEFHQQHRSAATAPRRDRSRHEHLWDPQGVTGMRLALLDFPAAVVVSPDLKLSERLYLSSDDLYAFYLSIVNALARLDAKE